MPYIPPDDITDQTVKDMAYRIYLPSSNTERLTEQINNAINQRLNAAAVATAGLKAAVSGRLDANMAKHFFVAQDLGKRLTKIVTQGLDRNMRRMQTVSKRAAKSAENQGLEMPDSLLPPDIEKALAPWLQPGDKAGDDPQTKIPGVSYSIVTDASGNPAGVLFQGPMSQLEQFQSVYSNASLFDNPGSPNFEAASQTVPKQLLPQPTPIQPTVIQPLHAGGLQTGGPGTAATSSTSQVSIPQSTQSVTVSETPQSVNELAPPNPTTPSEWAVRVQTIGYCVSNEDDTGLHLLAVLGTSASNTVKSNGSPGDFQQTVDAYNAVLTYIKKQPGWTTCKLGPVYLSVPPYPVITVTPGGVPCPPGYILMDPQSGCPSGFTPDPMFPGCCKPILTTEPIPVPIINPPPPPPPPPPGGGGGIINPPPPPPPFPPVPPGIIVPPPPPPPFPPVPPGIIVPPPPPPPEPPPPPPPVKKPPDNEIPPIPSLGPTPAPIEMPPGEIGQMCTKILSLEVGSEAFCLSMMDFTEYIGRVGDWFIIHVLQMDPDNCKPITNTEGCCAFWKAALDALGILTEITPYGRIISGAAAIIPEVISCVFQGFGLSKDQADPLSKNMDISYLTTLIRSAICQSWMNLIKCLPCNTRALLGALAVRTFIQLLDSIITKISTGMNFGVEAILDVGLDLSFNVGPWDRVLQYVIEWACPVTLLEQGEVTELYLRGYITNEHYICLMRMHGLSPAFHKLNIAAKQERLTPDEVIELSMRQLSGFQDNTFDTFKQLGLTNDETTTVIQRIEADLDSSGWKNAIDKFGKMGLFTEIPTISDHLEWQRRNVDDPTYTIPFLLWAGFDTKDNVKSLMEEELTKEGWLPGNQKQWDEAWEKADKIGIPDYLKSRNFWNTFKRDLMAQGMTKRAALLHYMQHWQPQPPTQAYRMLHRLRPDKYKDARAFTIDDLRKVLLEQGIQPVMIDRMIETSYNVIPRIDARRAYITGTLTREQFISIIMDEGNNADNAVIIAGFVDITATDTASKSLPAKQYIAGKINKDFLLALIKKLIPPASEEVNKNPKLTERLMLLLDTQRREGYLKSMRSEDVYKAYLAGTMSDSEMNTWLTHQRALTDDETQFLLGELQDKRDRKLRKDCLTAIRSRISGGELTPQEAGTAAASLNIPADLIAVKVAAWTCEFSISRKSLTLANMCEAAGAGYITPEYYQKRLLTLGYSELDVKILVQQCADKRAEKLQKQVERAQQKLDKANEQEQKRLEANIAKWTKLVLKYQDKSDALGVQIARMQAKAQKDIDKLAADQHRIDDRTAKQAFAAQDRAYRTGLGFVNYLIKAGVGQQYTIEQLYEYGTWILDNVGKRLLLPIHEVAKAGTALLMNYKPTYNPDVIQYLLNGLSTYYAALGAVMPPPGWSPPQPIETPPPGLPDSILPPQQEPVTPPAQPITPQQ